MAASRMEIIYSILKKNKGKMEFNELYSNLAEKSDITDNTPEDKASVFSDMTIDGRFLFSRTTQDKKETHYWDIRDNYTYEEIKESLSTFGDEGELSNDDVELMTPKRPTIASTATEADEEEGDSGDIDDAPHQDVDGKSTPQ